MPPRSLDAACATLSLKGFVGVKRSFLLNALFAFCKQRLHLALFKFVGSAGQQTFQTRQNNRLRIREFSRSQLFLDDLFSVGAKNEFHPGYHLSAGSITCR